MIFSLNNRLILEQYVKEGLKSERIHGIATPGQRDGLKGLKVLMGTKLSNGEVIHGGSIAYIREETLFTQPWASKHLKCPLFKDPVMIVEISYVEFISNSDPVA